MLRRSKGEVIPCVYCGKPATTRDHFPPKGLVPKGTPNLITVPSCGPCNQGASADDEYFRMALVLRYGVAGHPAIPAVTETVLKGVYRPQARGFRAALEDSLCLVDVHSAAGVDIGTVGGFRVDLTRLVQVVSRIVRGLFYHENGRALPYNYRCAVVDGSNPPPGLRPDLGQRLEQTCLQLVTTPPKSAGGDVLHYWFAPIDGLDSGLWLLRFYRSVLFAGMTGPRTPLA